MRLNFNLKTAFRAEAPFLDLPPESFDSIKGDFMEESIADPIELPLDSYRLKGVTGLYDAFDSL